VDAYYWTIPGGNPPASFVPNPSCVNYANAGLQTISMYVVDNGCVSAPVTANFNVIPDPVSQFMASATTICQGGDVNFSYTGAPVSANQSYLWSFPTGSPAISTLPNETVFFGSPGYYVVQLIVCNQFCCDTSTQTIFVSPGPQISAGIDRSFCAGDGPVMLLDTVLAGTGFAPYTYSWWCNAPLLCGITDPYVSHPMVNPGASPMTYYFQVTDNMGCRSNIDSTIVTVLEKPKVNAGPDQFICDAPTAPGAFLNGTVVNSAQVAGPYHYSWFCNTSPNCGMAVGSDTMPNPYVFPDQTTIYTLVVTAANGCSSDVTTLDTLSTTTVWVNETPIVDAGPTLSICYNASAILQGTLSGGGPNYTTIWTPNDAAAGLSNPAILNPTVSPDFTTLFTLSVTSNGCTGTDTTSVVVHTLPTGSIDPPVADICQGDTICLNGLADGDPTGVQYTYSWSALGGGSGGILNPTSGVACFSPLTTTTYQVHVASPYCAGFLDDVLLQVNPTPTPSITTQDTLICEGTTIQLKSTYSFTGTPVAAPVLFQWSPDDGSILDATVQNPFVTPTQNTVYELTTSVAGQCPRKDKVYVEVIPFAPLVASADTTLICKDGTVQLNVAGGNPTQHYTWSPGMYLNDSSIQNPIASLTDTTTFTVTVNAGGCTATDNITIYVAPTPTADFYHTNVHGCDTLAVQFFENTTDDLAYIWNFGDNTPVSNEQNPYHNFTVPGSYTTTLTVIGAGGCSATASQGPFVVHDGSFAGFYSIPSINDSIFLPDARVQFTDTSTGAITWLWDFGDGNISTEPNPSHTYLNAGKYPVTLTVTNEYGCSNVVMQSPYLVIAPDLFVPNIFTPNGDGIHDTWELMYLGTEKIAIAVYDRWGKLMYEHNNLETLWDGKNQAKPCSEGVYFYSIKIGKKIYNGNVTILR
jgi:gliding motility-associated-like protein